MFFDSDARLLCKPNHLLGYQRTYLQLNFRNVADLLRARKDLLPLALANSAKLDAVDAYAEVVEASSTMQMEMENASGWEGLGESVTSKKNRTADPRELITDIREYDVAYYLRVAIDNGGCFSSIVFLSLASASI